MTALKTLGGWRIEVEHSGALRRLASAQVLWVVFLLFALGFRNAFSFERLFVLWYFGFILSVHLFAPADSSSRLWRSVQAVVVLGFLGLCYVIATRAVEVLGI